MPTRRIRQAEIVRIFAERLRGLRSARGLTQRDLADKAGVALTYVSRLEAAGASPGIDLLERLAAALDVNVIDLLPNPSHPEAGAISRRQLKGLWDSVLAKAGPETLSMLRVFLDRLGESPLASR